MKAFIWLFVFMALALRLPADEVIREQVQVKWFAVPLAATDERGKCVADLKPDEIEVYLEGLKVDSFRLVRLSYAVEKDQEKLAPEVPVETLVTFLVFDNILTDSNRLNYAKAMAIDMVKRAEGRQSFVVMCLEYIGGLKYLCGPSRQTGEVINAIEKKVRASRSRFSFHAYAHDDIAVQNPYPTPEVLLTEAEKEAARREKMMIMERYRQTVLNYLEAMRTLSLALQTIRHKSVFLFSIGIKNGFFAADMFKTSEEMKSLDCEVIVDTPKAPDAGSGGSGIRGLQFMVGDLARRVNRTGAFLVVLNPEAANPSAGDPDSGGLMSHQLARDGGGVYLNSMKEDMKERALELTRAFYEVQFADPGVSDKEMLRVDVRGKRPGVSIHSLHHASRGRKYGELTGFEKELLAVDAAASSYWARSILAVRRERLPRPGISDKQAMYDLVLPPEFRQKEVDIFFVQVDAKRNDAMVSRQSLVPESDRYSYAVKPLQGYKPAFFIVCGRISKAILLQ